MNFTDQRKKDAIYLYRKGQLLREIGKKYNVTRERIRQILTEENDPTIMVDHKEAKKEMRKKYCLQCGKKFIPQNKNKKYCNLKCGDLAKRKKMNGRFNPYAHNTKEYYSWRYKRLKKNYPERYKKYAMQARKNIKTDPIRHAKQLEYQKQWFRKELKKIKTNSILLEKYQKYQRKQAKKYWAKIKADPILHAKYLKNARKRYAKRH